MGSSSRLASVLCTVLCVLVTAGCSMAPAARRSTYRELAAWLATNALPGETVGLQQHRNAWTHLTDHPQTSLPAGGDASELLSRLEATRPDYCIATRSVAWEGVQIAPWFQEHYRQVASVAVAEDPASPMTLYRYHRPPFDAGEATPLGRTLQDDAAGQLTVQSVQISSRRLAPGEANYISLTLAGNLREPLKATWRLRDPVSGRAWVQQVQAQPGGAPTDVWPADRAVVERFTVVPPDGLPPGDYALEVAFTRPNGAPFGEPVVLATLLRPPDVAVIAPEPDHAVEILADDAIALVGYDAPQHLEPGSTLRVALYWHALDAVKGDYKVFVHVFGPEGTLVMQSDASPVDWRYPTTMWQPGEFVRDVHTVVLDAALPRGDYPVWVGMYDAATGERLALRDTAGAALRDDVAPLYVLRVR